MDELPKYEKIEIAKKVEKIKIFKRIETSKEEMKSYRQIMEELIGEIINFRCFYIPLTKENIFSVR